LKISAQHCHRDQQFHCNLKKIAGELEASIHEALKDALWPDKRKKKRKLFQKINSKDFKKKKTKSVLQVRLWHHKGALSLDTGNKVAYEKVGRINW
jgi:hypothetical protein